MNPTTAALRILLAAVPDNQATIPALDWTPESEVVRLARELVATADLSEPRRMTTTVSSDHLAELMEALEAIDNAR